MENRTLIKVKRGLRLNPPLHPFLLSDDPYNATFIPLFGTGKKKQFFLQLFTSFFVLKNGSYHNFYQKSVDRKWKTFVFVRRKRDYEGQVVVRGLSSQFPCGRERGDGKGGKGGRDRNYIRQPLVANRFGSKHQERLLVKIPPPSSQPSLLTLLRHSQHSHYVCSIYYCCWKSYYS